MAMGWDLLFRVSPQEIIARDPKLRPPDGEFARVVREMARAPISRMGWERLHLLWQAVQNTAGLGLPVAEVGVYCGGSARLIAHAMAACGLVKAELHLFDTFSGHDQVDPEVDGHYQRDGGQAYVSPAMMEDWLGRTPTAEERTHLPLLIAQRVLAGVPGVRWHIGPVQERTAEVAALRFGFVHLDADIYRPTLHSLEFFWPRLAMGGVVVLDDYGFITCPGSRAAAEEFTAGHSDLQRWEPGTGQLVLIKTGGVAT